MVSRIPLSQIPGAADRLKEFLHFPVQYSAQIDSTQVEFSFSYRDLFALLPSTYRLYLKGSMCYERVIRGNVQLWADHDFVIKGFSDDNWNLRSYQFLAVLAGVAQITYRDSASERDYFWKERKICTLPINSGWPKLPFCGQLFLATGLKNKLSVISEKESHLLLTLPMQMGGKESPADLYFLTRTEHESFCSIDAMQIEFTLNKEAELVVVDGYQVNDALAHGVSGKYSIRHPEMLYDPLKAYVYRLVRGQSCLESVEGIFCQKFDFGKFSQSFGRYVKSKAHFFDTVQRKIAYLVTFAKVLRRNSTWTPEGEKVFCALMRGILEAKEETPALMYEAELYIDFTEGQYRDEIPALQEHFPIDKREVFLKALRVGVFLPRVFESLDRKEELVTAFISTFDKTQFKVGKILFEKTGSLPLFQVLYAARPTRENGVQLLEVHPELVLEVIDLVSFDVLFHFYEKTKEILLKKWKSFDEGCALYKKAPNSELGEQLRVCAKTAKEKKDLDLLFYEAAFHQAHFEDFEIPKHLPENWEKLRKLCEKYQGKKYRGDVQQKVKALVVGYIGKAPEVSRKQLLSACKKVPLLQEDPLFFLSVEMECEFVSNKHKPQVMLKVFRTKEKEIFALPEGEFFPIYYRFVQQFAASQEEGAHEILAQGMVKVKDPQQRKIVLSFLDPHLAYLSLVACLKSSFQEWQIGEALPKESSSDLTTLDGIVEYLSKGNPESFELCRFGAEDLEKHLEKLDRSQVNDLRSFQDQEVRAEAALDKVQGENLRLLQRYLRVLYRFHFKWLYDQISRVMTPHYIFLIEGIRIFLKLTPHEQKFDKGFFQKGHCMWLEALDRAGEWRSPVEVDRLIALTEYLTGVVEPRHFAAWVGKTPQIGILDDLIFNCSRLCTTVLLGEEEKKVKKCLARLKDLAEMREGIVLLCAVENRGPISNFEEFLILIPELLRNTTAFAGSPFPRLSHFIQLKEVVLPRLLDFIQLQEEPALLQRNLILSHSLLSEAGKREELSPIFKQNLYRFHIAFILQSLKNNPAGLYFEHKILFPVLKAACRKGVLTKEETLGAFETVLGYYIGSPPMLHLFKQNIWEFSQEGFLPEDYRFRLYHCTLTKLTKKAEEGIPSVLIEAIDTFHGNIASAENVQEAFIYYDIGCEILHLGIKALDDGHEGIIDRLICLAQILGGRTYPEKVKLWHESLSQEKKKDLFPKLRKICDIGKEIPMHKEQMLALEKFLS